MTAEANEFPTLRLRFACSEPLKYGANAAAQYDDPDWPRFVRITDLTDDGRLKQETFRSLPPEEAAPYLLDDGDVLLARSGSIGRSFIYRPEWGTVCHAGYLIRARLSQSFDSKFVYWALNSSSYWAWIEGIAIRSTIQNVSAEKYADYAVPAPPLETQWRIAQFLDEKTARIDGLIEKKRALLDRLAEKRQALITRAVTKGLNPDAPMKPSGIDWLGDIPAHWEIRRLKEVCQEIVDCKNRTPPNIDDGEYFVIRTSCLGGSRFDPAGGYWTDEESFREWTKKGTPQENDVLISREAPMGEACLFPVGYALCLGQRMMLARADTEKLDPHFLLFSIYSDVGREYVELRKKGTTVGHLRVPEVLNFPVMLPTIAEQREIIEVLRLQLEDLRGVECGVTTSIAKLEEYRAALISAAVTGQVAELQ